jgi:hypothetical protein
MWHWRGEYFQPLTDGDFAPVIEHICNEPVLFIEKYRDLMISWLCVGFFTHAAMTNPEREVLFQSQKEDRRTRSGVEVLRLHYSADPERNLNWVSQERQKYSSRAAWDREQEIIHHPGGGELLFAEILNRHADKIIIRDSRFQIPPFWKRIGGFDHGKTNPTAPQNPVSTFLRRRLVPTESEAHTGESSSREGSNRLE